MEEDLLCGSRGMHACTYSLGTTCIPVHTCTLRDGEKYGWGENDECVYVRACVVLSF